MKGRIIGVLVVLALLGGLAWGAMKLVRAAAAATTTSAGEVPTIPVRRGTVSITVSARGELQGGNSEMVVVPPLGADSTAITFLRSPGELVQAGDTVVELDNTLQEYTLREAQADLAEADQQVIQAQATADSADEENRMALLQSQSDVSLAELNVRSNPVLPAIKAKENDLALVAAQNRLRHAQQNLQNKNDSAVANVNVQKANQNKAKVTAEMTGKIIENMVVKAKTSGYVSLQPNTRGQMIWYDGMTFPSAQVGDTVYSGSAIAQVLDLHNWEVSAHIGELDRGHLSEGQKVSVKLVAVPGRIFQGHVKLLGGTTGPPWDRNFDCRIALDEASLEMRPGLSTNLVITTQTMENVTWLPSQALFESGGKKFVYQRTAQGFAPHDVTLVSRSESQVVITGLKEGELVAMSNPEQQNKPAASQKNSAMNALQK